MDRRGFLMALAGLAGAGAVTGFALSPAQATPLSQLKNMAPPEGEAIDLATEAATDGTAGMTPDGTPLEQAQWGPPPGHGWGPPGPPRGRYRRRRRRVCGWRRDRWGRPIRRCWYTWR